jgi:hypothetical protein
MKKWVFGFVLVLIFTSSWAQRTEGDSWLSVKSFGAGTLAVLYYEQAGLIQEVNVWIY